MKIKIAICENNIEYTDFLQKKIKKLLPYDDIEIYRFFDNQEFILSKKDFFDIVFLNYEMDTVDEMSMSYSLREVNKEAILVFLSKNELPHPRLFKLNTFRFIMKYENKNAVDEELISVFYYLKDKRSYKYIIVNVGKIKKVIDIGDILYISKNKRGSKIVLYKNEEESLDCKETLDDLYGKLRSRFEYPHSSYIVNFDNIVGFERSNIIMKDGSELSISSSKKMYFESRVSLYIKKMYGDV